MQFSIALSWLLSGGLAVKKIIFPFNVLCVTSTAILLCLIISTCCCAKIFNRLRRQEMQVHSHFQQGQQKTGLEATLNITQYKKTVSSALCVQIAFFFCYLPHLITLLLLSAQVIMGKCRPTSSLASEIGILFVYLNSSLNPFLYCWKKRAVRKEVKSIIRRWCYLSSVVSLH